MRIVDFLSQHRGTTRQIGNPRIRIGVGGELGVTCAQYARQHTAVLTHIESRQMESERANAPAHTPHCKSAGMPALVRMQAAFDEFQVVQQIL